LWISALRKDTIEEKKVIISLQKKIENVQNIDTDEGNKLWVEKISEIKNEENDEAISIMKTKKI
jgi:hypothetical protein